MSGSDSSQPISTFNSGSTTLTLVELPPYIQITLFYTPTYPRGLIHSVHSGGFQYTQLDAHTSHTTVTAGHRLSPGTLFHAGIRYTASTPTHRGLPVVLCCQLLLRRLLLGRRQRHPVLLTYHPPPLLPSPGPLPTRPPSASLHFLLLICPERGMLRASPGQTALPSSPG